MRRLDEGWELARAGEDDWVPARVPGTVASAMADAGRWVPGAPEDLDEHDWVFRVRFDAPELQAGERATLRLDGIATYADVALNGREVARTAGMFTPHAAEVAPLLRPMGNELTITCRALAPLLALPRKPRARWRTRLVDNGLRWHRTMLLGRMPGIAPSPAAVGPWRPVRLEFGDPAPHVRVRPRLDGDDGILEVSSAKEVDVEVAGQRTTVVGTARLVLPRVERWWPHTHGEPVLHELRVGDDTRHVGFRAIAATEPFGLSVNGVEVFARGAVWTPQDPVGLAADPAALRAALEQVRDAGMNILRVVGTGCYESPAFHDLCDELGILVWQDLMFANLDYPIADAGFAAQVTAEAEHVLAEIAGRPSTAVVCGNSEVEQQVAMLGLDPALGRGELFGELLPRLVSATGTDAVYLPSAPCGPGRPFRPDTGVAHWFGVGGYRRPLADARAAGVHFAAECLAFSNLGDADGPAPAGIPADRGADWDFADVRDHYLAEVYGQDPAALVARDPDRYVALGRQATGEAMARVLGEWRRTASPCSGAIVLWLKDRAPGAGWGLVDHRGVPKAALGPVRRALAPVAVWVTDEGMSGLAVHVANDRARALGARLRVALYTGFERLTGEATRELALAPHAGEAFDVEELLGRFADVSWAYRFGPPAQDTVVATLEDADGELLSQAFHFPVGHPLEPTAAGDLGLEVTRSGGRVHLVAARVVHGVRLHAPGALAADDAFSLEPGYGRSVALRGEPTGSVVVSALNLDGTLEA